MKSRFVFASIPTAVMLCGCAYPVYVQNPNVVQAPLSYGVIADAPVAPPTPIYEVIPPVPFMGAVWITGFWFWEGGRHVWRAGHYERGQPGRIWVPHQWEHHGGRWQLRDGHWR